jgi:hypothetical protein
MHTRLLAILSVRRAAAILAVAALSACQSSPPRPAEPELKLLKSAELVVPEDCFVSGSFIVSFTVVASGLTDAIRAPDSPGCIQAALTAWVASFRYEPPARATPATVEWMMVTGKRGS